MNDDRVLGLDEAARKELAAFPAVLLTLLDAELAAGNRIVELRHGHPAPPIGACVMLERKVSTRPRASGDGLSHRERRSSSSSGEFTDAARVFFVLEPPDPPPPEPDMDAIRRLLEPKPSPLVTLAERSVRSIPPTFGTPPARPPGTETRTEREDGLEYEFHFRDPRTPHELRAVLEHLLVVLFVEASDGDRLAWRATAHVNGAVYRFALRFAAATADDGRYTLQIAASWQSRDAATLEYHRKASRRWIEMWTREFSPAPPPGDGAAPSERYRELADDARRREAELDSIPAVQRAILAGVMRGGRYARSHKEGGTQIYCRAGRLVRSDHGDDPADVSYASEAEFLAMLRAFCEPEIRRWAGPEGVSELDAWKLILRRMLPE